jgi:metal-responsive CopG/Arc/MetJ family transcriptional regulator
MAKLKVTVSLSRELLGRIDAARKGRSRSASVEALLRQALVERAWAQYARDINDAESREMREAAEESEVSTARALATDER